MARENTRTARAIATMIKMAGKPMEKIVDAIADASEVPPNIARNYYNWVIRQNYPEVVAAEKAKGAFERPKRGGRASDKPAATARVSATVKSATGKKSPAKKAAAKKAAPAKRKAGATTKKAGAKSGAKGKAQSRLSARAAAL